MRAYHFLKDDMTAGSGNEPPWKVGEKRTCKGKVHLCQSGYHSSPSWYDALNYAPGNMACIVEISKPIKKDDTKSVSKTRKLIACKDASATLRIWGCDCAERALKRTKVTDERSWNAIKIARKFAVGEATKEELAVARDAARDAARVAAWDAAWDAARVAARVAARDAARVAAWDAARVAEIEWQRKHLDELMAGLFGEAK